MLPILDPGDVRVNTALGINYFKKARFEDAEHLFRKALERLTDKYTSPKDGEAFYYLGLTLKAQGRDEAAFDALYKATWSLAWRAAGYFELAEIAAKRGETARALDLVNRSLEANAPNTRALNLKAALLRRLGRPEEALQILASASGRTDPLDVRALAERWLASKRQEDASVLTAVMVAHAATGLETAAEYLTAGLWQDGADVLSALIAAAPDRTRVNPLFFYYLGYFEERIGHPSKATDAYQLASRMPPDHVFPFQYEVIDVLRQAMKANPRDARAPYYLGNLLFDWQPEEAITCWKASAALDPSFAIVHRNLGVAYAHRKPTGDLDNAIAEMEQAVRCNEKYALHFAELDELYEEALAPVEKRLDVLSRNQGIVVRRDNATNRLIALLVAAGRYDEAVRMLSSRRFAVAEGANLNVAEHWVNAHLLRDEASTEARRYREALADLRVAFEIPPNIPRENLTVGSRSAEIAYWTGVASEGLGERDKARQSWEKGATPTGPDASRAAATRPGVPASAAESYYRGLCLRKLGQEAGARAVFESLVKSGQEALQAAETGAGAGEGPSALRQMRARKAAARYAAGLGCLGLGDDARARDELRQALQASPDHLGARTALARLEQS
jgi:tetratricopeptide (TPR) repeat protein